MTEIINNKNGVSFDIDAIVTDLNGKMDIDGVNASCSVCVESYHDGNSWYRIYSDGFCEQGAYYTGNVNGWVTVNFLKSYASLPNVQMSRIGSTGDDSGGLDRRFCMVRGITNSSFNCWGIWDGYSFSWYARGYIR